MTRGIAPWLAAATATLGFGLLIALNSPWASVGMLAILATVVYGAIASAIKTEGDHDWILRWVVLGLWIKLIGTWVRHYMVTVFYESGDAFRYYLAGTELAAQFGSGGIPPLPQDGGGSFGTRVMEYITGAIFSIYTPDLLGAFFIFSIVAFGGQLMLYVGFRHWAKPAQLKPYALMIFALPTFAFWPSSLGKDAVVLFALGGAAYFTSRTLKAFEFRWLIGLAVFLGLLGLIRIHIAGLVVLGLVGAGLVSRMPKAHAGIFVRRIILVGSFVAAGGLVLALFPDIFGVDITGEESLDTFTADVVRRTSERGTVAAGSPVNSPADIPEAIALVLFRPYAFEASELQHFFAAAETTLILLFSLWKLPEIVRNRREWRANGYVVFATVYTIAYAIAFSVVRQLGIIARQRGQVLAFFLVIVIALGWSEGSSKEDAADDADSASKRLEMSW